MNAQSVIKRLEREKDRYINRVEKSYGEPVSRVDAEANFWLENPDLYDEYKMAKNELQRSGGGESGQAKLEKSERAKVDPVGHSYRWGLTGPSVDLAIDAKAEQLGEHLAFAKMSHAERVAAVMDSEEGQAVYELGKLFRLTPIGELEAKVELADADTVDAVHTLYTWLDL